MPVRFLSAAEIEQRSGERGVSINVPASAMRRRMQPEISAFPPDRLVRELLNRWWSLRVGSRGSSHNLGGPSGADLRNSVNLALARAKRLARQHHPGEWSRRPKTRPTSHQLTCRICLGIYGPDGERVFWPLQWSSACPVEAFYKARDAANRAVERAARYQFQHMPGGWRPNRNPKRDTSTEARLRALWARADGKCIECDKAETDPAFDLVIRFLGLVLATSCVQEDPESFTRYAVP